MSPVFSVFLVAVTVGSFGMQALRIRRHGAAGVSRSTSPPPSVARWRRARSWCPWSDRMPWGIYGILVADIWMTGASVIATALSLAIVLVVVGRRRGVAAPAEVDAQGMPVVGPA